MLLHPTEPLDVDSYPLDQQQRAIAKRFGLLEEKEEGGGKEVRTHSSRYCGDQYQELRKKLLARRFELQRRAQEERALRLHAAQMMEKALLAEQAERERFENQEVMAGTWLPHDGPDGDPFLRQRSHYDMKMQHVFQSEQARTVQCVRFCNEGAGSDVFACGFADGCVWLCSAVSCKIICEISQHTHAVMDIAWIASNDNMLTVSLDKCVCIWKISFTSSKQGQTPKNGSVREKARHAKSEGESRVQTALTVRPCLFSGSLTKLLLVFLFFSLIFCARILVGIAHTVDVVAQCIRIAYSDWPVVTGCFCPQNNNLAIVCAINHTGKGQIRVLNVSTGIVVQTIHTSSRVTAATFNDLGDQFFVADASGSLISYKFEDDIVAQSKCVLKDRCIVINNGRRLSFSNLNIQLNLNFDQLKMSSQLDNMVGRTAALAKGTVFTPSPQRKAGDKPNNNVKAPYIVSLSHKRYDSAVKSPCMLVTDALQQVRIVSLDRVTGEITEVLRMGNRHSGGHNNAEAHMPAHKDPSSKIRFTTACVCRKSDCIVAGGENRKVYIYYPHRKAKSERGKQTMRQSHEKDALAQVASPLLKCELSGHSAPISSLSWNAAETALVSADENGDVIVWYRMRPKDFANDEESDDKTDSMSVASSEYSHDGEYMARKAAISARKLNNVESSLNALVNDVATGTSRKNKARATKTKMEGLGGFLGRQRRATAPAIAAIEAVEALNSRAKKAFKMFK